MLIQPFKIGVTTEYVCRVSCLAQTGFSAFGKTMQLISGPPYDETRERSQLISLNGFSPPYLC